MVTRHNREKTFVSLDELESATADRLCAVHDGLYKKALDNRANRTFECKNTDEINEVLKNADGFIKAAWCGSQECEDKVKELTGVGSRCLPTGEQQIDENAVCVCCGKKAEHRVLWARAY
jgi:prolyl-tRNA synthetase